MPWKECSVMDDRLQFVARRLAGDAMAELWREARSKPVKMVMRKTVDEIGSSKQRRRDYSQQREKAARLRRAANEMSAITLLEPAPPWSRHPLAGFAREGSRQ